MQKLKEQQKKVGTILKKKYKIVVLSESSFEEKVAIDLSFGRLLTLLFSLAVIGTLPLYVVLSKSDALQTDASLRKKLMVLSLRTDSLQQLANAHETYIQTLQKVTRGELDYGALKKDANKLPQPQSLDKDDPKRPKDDIELRKTIEIEGGGGIERQKKQLKKLSFRKPIEGNIIKNFDEGNGVNGVVIAAKPNTMVYPSMGGKVLSASKMKDNTWSILVGHENGLMTCYQHCSVLLKKVGKFVTPDDAIAQMGDEKYESELYFEVRSGSKPINPRLCLKF